MARARKFPTPMRHRKVLRDNLDGIAKADIRRLARRGGVQRLSGTVYHEVRGVLKLFLQRIMGSAVIYSEYARRKTVTVYDIIHALKREGHTLFGYDPIPRRLPPPPPSRRRVKKSSPPRQTQTQPEIAIPNTTESATTAPQIDSPPAPLGPALVETTPIPNAVTQPVDNESQPKTPVRTKTISRKEVPGYGN